MNILHPENQTVVLIFYFLPECRWNNVSMMFIAGGSGFVSVTADLF